MYLHISTTLNSEIWLPHTNFSTFHTIQIFIVYLQKFTTFELSVVVIETYGPPCVQTEISIEIFVDFDGLESNFIEVRQPNC